MLNICSTVYTPAFQCFSLYIAGEQGGTGNLDLLPICCSMRMPFSDYDWSTVNIGTSYLLTVFVLNTEQLRFTTGELAGSHILWRLR